MALFPEPTQPRSYADVMASLPPEYSDASMLDTIRAEIVRSGRKVVVLDDDPTGPQATSDVFILTDWSVDALRRELTEPRPLFFVLTNTRSMALAQAVELNRHVAANLERAATEAGVPYSVVSRGDSTLRGHYPDEVEALGACDGTIIVPFFQEGGRFTFDDVQWVKEEECLIPAALTPYARDMVFGYSHSHLCNWIEEKSLGRIQAANVLSVALDVLRRGGPDTVEQILLASRRQTIIINTMSYRDLEVLVIALLRAESQGRRFIVRSAASFVRVRGGQAQPHVGWDAAAPAESSRGGLIIVGSHVPKSTTQLNQFLNEHDVVACELPVAQVISGNAVSAIRQTSERVNAALAANRSAVVYTTREVQALESNASLDAGKQIISALIAIVRSLRVRPRFIITKGGWTASEIGTKALAVRRAYEPAPILPGVPMWVLGPESRFPGMPYVIFPGNVGDERALAEVVRQLAA